MHPTGRQPPGVYWFRRILVLLVLLVLLLGLRWLLGGRSGGSPSAASSTGPTASSTPSAGPTASSTPPAGPTTTAPTSSSAAASSASARPTATATGTPACTKDQIAVTATTDAASYPVGSTPHLRMKIENVSSSACTRDVGAAQNELVITSGTAHVWSSDDCNPGGTPQVVTMAPGQSYSVAVTWLGRLSQKGCPANQPMATKGTYRLTGINGTVTSAPAIFALT